MKHSPTVFQATTKTCEQIKNLSDWDYKQFISRLTNNNQHTEAIIVVAVRKNAQENVLLALLTVHGFNIEFGYLHPEVSSFRDWLYTRVAIL